MSIIHVFSIGNALLDITSIFNTLELINNIYITYIALANIPEHWGSIYHHSAGPFRRFSMCVWQNACVNTIRRVMVCDVYFTFSKIL